jgi:hypothetical protein
VLAIEARELVSAWRPDSNRLVVKGRAPVGRGRRVAVKISGVVGVTAPVTGRVADARLADGMCVAEVEVDPDRRPLLKRVVKYLRGEADVPRSRAPRYRLAVPVVVSSASGRTYMTTFSVSQGGCGLVWSGERPRIGGGLHLRMGARGQSASVRAAVCWVSEERGGLRVGVRFLPGEELDVGRLLDEAREEAVPT